MLVPDAIYPTCNSQYTEYSASDGRNRTNHLDEQRDDHEAERPAVNDDEREPPDHDPREDAADDPVAPPLRHPRERPLQHLVARGALILTNHLGHVVQLDAVVPVAVDIVCADGGACRRGAGLLKYEFNCYVFGNDDLLTCTTQPMA